MKLFGESINNYCCSRKEENCRLWTQVGPGGVITVDIQQALRGVLMSERASCGSLSRETGVNFKYWEG